MLGYLSAEINYSEKRTVFRERSSRKTVSFARIAFVEKYTLISWVLAILGVEVLGKVLVLMLFG